VKKLLSLLAGAAVVALGTAQATQAAVLGTEDFTVSGGVSDIFTEFKPTLAIAPAEVGPGPNVSSPATNASLFGGTSVTPADVGRTFTATQSSDPNFTEFVTLLTSGKPNKVTLSFGAGKVENSELFLTKTNPLFGQETDLFGSEIDSIDLRIDSLTLKTPGTDPNSNGVWTDYSFSGVAILEGEPVPEPISAISTLLFGFVVIGSNVVVKRVGKFRKTCVL